MGKRFCENVKQTHSSQSESDSRKSKIKSFITKNLRKISYYGNYEKIRFEKVGKNLK